MSKSPIKNTKRKNSNEDGKDMLICIVCQKKIHISNLKHSCN